LKKLGKVSLICLLAILLVGCQSTERYLKFRDDLDAKLTRALKIVPDSIRDMEKGDAILCEADMILLDYLIEICGMIIDLAPSKEMAKYHEAWSEYAEAIIELAKCTQEYLATADVAELAKMKVHLELCASLLDKANNEYQQVLLDKLTR
jgi:hypothetical protein